ncbi:MAG: type II toxin-antitoxin system Phd/YefM family antitoxin [Candidatus Peregrinibacteria bacterium]
MKDKIISIRDLRAHLSQVATEVKTGAIFTVYRFGYPCFRIVPYKSLDDIEKRLQMMIEE